MKNVKQRFLSKSEELVCGLTVVLGLIASKRARKLLTFSLLFPSAEEHC